LGSVLEVISDITVIIYNNAQSRCSKIKNFEEQVSFYNTETYKESLKQEKIFSHLNRYLNVFKIIVDY